MSTTAAPIIDIQDGPLAEAFQKALATYAPIAPRDGLAGGTGEQESAHQGAVEAFEALISAHVAGLSG